jgi:hypothetical protein
VSLLSESWHAAARIVHCTIEFPFENRSGIKQTVAGVKIDLLVYKFVDGRLFQISAYFDTREFDRMRAPLIDKYGEPWQEEKKPVKLIWWNGCSTIILSRGTISPQVWSTLDFSHDELISIVASRVPDRTEDL